MYSLSIGSCLRTADFYHHMQLLGNKSSTIAILRHTGMQ